MIRTFTVTHAAAHDGGQFAGLVVRTVGKTCAETKITLANLAYNMRRLTWLEGRPAPA